MVSKMVIAVLAYSVATLAFASPGHSENDNPNRDEAPSFAAGKPGKKQTVDRVIQVEASDRMQFNPDDWRIHPGETIRFIVTNTGQIPHEFVIDTVRGNTTHRKNMMKAMADGDMMEHDDPNAVSVEPDETAELIWTFTETGTFEAACNLPGHYQAGMRALIRVSESTL